VENAQGCSRTAAALASAPPLLSDSCFQKYLHTWTARLFLLSLLLSSRVILLRSRTLSSPLSLPLPVVVPFFLRFLPSSFPSFAPLFIFSSALPSSFFYTLVSSRFEIRSRVDTGSICALPRATITCNAVGLSRPMGTRWGVLSVKKKEISLEPTSSGCLVVPSTVGERCDLSLLLRRD